MMLTDTQIAKLEELGGKRWIKGNMDRIYFNCSALDCEFRYYKSGRIAEAWHKFDKISNSDGYRCKAAKSYIDVKTGEAKSTEACLQVSLDERLAEALAE